MMDAMKCFINQRDVSDRMKSHLPPSFSLLTNTHSLSKSLFLPFSERGREGPNTDREKERERKEK
jgi:hypothetical protein